MDREVQVSVYCLAYNHEKYIRKTLEGFVNQKTNFRFKVVVHDDASTDRTAEIIREFEEKYPDIFDVIYQTENQYFNPENFIAKYMTPRIEGKYVAYCEGDDYWCDENKLQKQFDIMEANPDLICSFHRVAVISEAGKPLHLTYPRRKQETGFLTSRQFIDGVCNDFYQLSSLFCKADVAIDWELNPPEYAQLADVGDIPMYLHLGAMSEKIYFIDEVMSCYRYGSVSSITRAMARSAEKQKRHQQNMIAMINAFDEYTQGRFCRECESFREQEIFGTYVNLRDIRSICKDPVYRRRLAKMPPRAQLSIAIKGFLLLIKNKVRD